MLTSRRQILQAIGGAIVTSRFATGCGDEPNNNVVPPPLVQYTLTCKWITTTMDGLTVKLRSYNGMVPGPLLTFRPGDRLEITIDNQLTPYDSSQWAGDHNVPHDLNTTNLHVHGLDVVPHLFEPLGTSDPASDMIAIAPGETYTYVFDIPEDHPSGFDWYHPHHHGSTAVQAVSGMAGGIIVKGPIDEVPEIAAARDLQLVMSDIGLFHSDDESNVWIYEPKQNAIWNTFGVDGAPDLVRIWNPTAMPPAWVPKYPELKGGFTTGDYAVRFYCANGSPFYREDHNPQGGTEPVGKALPNGQMQIAMQPGEVLRLRVLNAGSDLVMPLVIPNLELHLIALDGVPFGAPRTMKTVEPAPMGMDPVPQWDGVVDYNASATSLVLGPGNRAEMLLKAPDMPGTYEIVQLHHVGQQFLASDRKVIATITVAGDAKPMNLPTALPKPARFQPPIQQSDITKTETLQFTGAFPPTQNHAVGVDFSLNDKQYEVHTINTTVALGTAEEWDLSAMKHADGNSEGHPFHIHVNSFEVKKIGALDQPEGTIMDTLWIGLDQDAKIWIRYKQWAGKTVYHCHILPHEDTGMMGNLLITKS